MVECNDQLEAGDGSEPTLKVGKDGRLGNLATLCQTAPMLILEPIFEADMPQEQHAYRQNRNAQSAVREVLGSHLDFLG